MPNITIEVPANIEGNTEKQKELTRFLLGLKHEKAYGHYGI